MFLLTSCLTASFEVITFTKRYGRLHKKVWSPSVGEVLLLVKEEGNEHDRFAVSVMKDGFIVGNAPRELSKLFTHF